ncbi:MAG: SHD1 domain-containing protein [Planctomycetota bacterium]
MRVQFVIGMTLVMWISDAVLAESRTWTSSSGDYSVEAELTSTGQEDVILTTSEGREIKIALSKLSQQDRDYIASLAERKQTDKDTIKATVVSFYEAVRDDPPKLRDYLTTEGQANFDTQRGYFKMGAPQANDKPRVTGVRFEDDQVHAVARFRIRLGGDLQKMEMLFRREDDAWRVHGLVGLGKTSRTIMDFDQAQSRQEPLRKRT